MNNSMTTLIIEISDDEDPSPTFQPQPSQSINIVQKSNEPEVIELYVY